MLSRSSITINSFIKQHYRTKQSRNFTKLTILDYNDLIINNIDTSLIEVAYGYNGLGILAVKNIPLLSELRKKLLPLSYQFANLPNETKLVYEHPNSYYSFGWSHGKEKMSNGNYDISKGSYYNNPIYDLPFKNNELIKKYPSFCSPNIWPSKHLPLLENSFKQLSYLVVHTGQMVARTADRYVSEKTGKDFDMLHKTVACSRTHKARLLHYYASEESTTIDNWCGMHNDHGTLTGLVPAMFHDENGNEVMNNPDSKAGLYVQNRKGETVHVKVPSDCLAFQIGETAQIHTGGLLVATPHAVKSAPGKISRSTLAVFMEPQMEESMKPLVGNNDDVTKSGNVMPKGVPTLGSRWNSKQNFSEFSEATLKSYY